MLFGEAEGGASMVEGGRRLRISVGWRKTGCALCNAALLNNNNMQVSLLLGWVPWGFGDATGRGDEG